MVVDTSVLTAIALEEEGWQSLLVRVESEPNLRISAASYVELGIVLCRRLDETRAAAMQSVVMALGIEIVPLTVSQASLAIEAYRRFGKSRHPAALNFGDCFSYALAKQLGEPLLFQGEDFNQTDVTIA